MAISPKLSDEVKHGPLGAFDPRMFKQAIQGLGLEFKWSRAVECPCRLEGTDQYDPTCANCGGDGWMYVLPTTDDRHISSRDHAVVTCTFGQANMKPSLFESFGQFTFADALMTMQSEMRVAYHDRFIGAEQEMAWTELLLSSGTGATIKVGKTGRTRDEQLQAMRYEPTSVNFVADEDDVRYYRHEHWRILEPTEAEPSRFKFNTGAGPATGKRWTIHYNCRPVWIVDEATYAVQGLRGPISGMKGKKTPITLPTTFKVRLDFLTLARGT